MEFHGTLVAPISLEVPWNSMEFHRTLGAPILLTLAVPWNSMDLWVRQFRWHEQFHGIPWNFDYMSSSMEFHGIPWNLECANFPDSSRFIEFHGTRSAPISLTQAVPWNSMEPEVRQFRWHEKFHGIPWNFGCTNFADTSSSMEFHGT